MRGEKYGKREKTFKKHFPYVSSFSNRRQIAAAAQMRSRRDFGNLIDFPVAVMTGFANPVITVNVPLDLLYTGIHHGLLFCVLRGYIHVKRGLLNHISACLFQFELLLRFRRNSDDGFLGPVTFAVKFRSECIVCAFIRHVPQPRKVHLHQFVNVVTLWKLSLQPQPDFHVPGGIKRLQFLFAGIPNLLIQNIRFL